jgi:hypothetical protein
MKKERKNQCKTTIIIIVLILSMIFILPTMPVVSAETYTMFGYEYVGKWSNELYEPQYGNTIQGSNFICPSSGIADNMSVYIANWDSSTNVACAIYSINGGTLIGQTEELTIGYQKKWFTFNFIGEPSLVADTQYLLVVWGDDGYIRYDNDISHDLVGYTGLTYTGDFPDSIAGYGHFDGFVVSIYCRYTEYESNNPPNTPSNPNPVNYATSVDINADLSWTGGDPDSGDTVTYDVYFGTSSNPSIVSTGQSGTSYDPGAMSYNTKYYWKIVAKDNHGATTTGPIWDFITGAESNNPPNTPSNPNPVNHAISVDINADLSWTGGDPDSSDTVTYNIYFGTSSNPPLKKSGYTSTTYDPGVMNSNTKYYWKIVANDNHGGSATGPIWDLTTGTQTNNPPNTPTKPSGPTQGVKNTKYYFKTSTIDPEDDQVYYKFDWGDGKNSGWLGPYNSGTTITASHKWTARGTYYVKVKAKDVYGMQSDWSPYLIISIV